MSITIGIHDFFCVYPAGFIVPVYSLVADHLILAAANLGLETCWIAAFNVEAARSVLQFPEEAEPVIFTPLGYPADQPGPKLRKQLSELVRYERW